jgi:acetoacetyl-CoA synthetase
MAAEHSPEQPLWQPSAERQARSHLYRFMECLRARQGREFKDYAELHRWSIDEPDRFWFEVAHFTHVLADWADAPVLQHGERLPGAKWFPGAQLNYAENLLRHDDDHPALIACDEQGHERTLSHRQLRQEVARIAAGMRAAGLQPGDRVAAFLPNLAETVVAMLAASSIGAIWSSCSPDFGLRGVIDRFGQIEPTMLLAVDGYRYAGKRIDSRAAVENMLTQLPSVRQVLIIPLLDPTAELDPWIESLSNDGRQSIPWQNFGNAQAKLEFNRLPFDHPLFILYSSGTTGVPKCIVHAAGGALLMHLKEHQLHADLQRDDRLFYFTTCGWMMWNWLVSALASGAALVLFDGSPFHPDEGVLWRMAESLGVTHFGTSPKYLASLEKAGFHPAQEVALPALRMLLSTGSPLPASSFHFVYESIKRDVHLASISGGTDLLGCFIIGDPLAPVYAGELQCAALGMAVDVVDADGQSLPPGEKGELVCRQSFPSVPLGFWNDTDGTRLHRAYFAHYPGLWHHGDYAERTVHGGYLIHGRSDAVLNPGGVRIGTAEIYRVVDTLPEILESVCVGQRWQDDVRVVLFVKLRPGLALNDSLQATIRQSIREQTSPRHVPSKILAVNDIPRTLSGKIVELAVSDVIHGRVVARTDALANPAALEEFRNRPELAS